MESKTKRSWVNKWYIVYFALAAVIIGVSLYSKFVLHTCIVSGDSMFPTLKNGDIVSCKVDFKKEDISRGDIVVIQMEDERWIKRVVALPGEALRIDNGQIYVGRNGEFTPTGYEFDPIEDPGVLPGKTSAPLFLDSDQYFCVGDNRNDSIDCRKFGPIRFDQIERIVVEKKFANIGLIL